MKNLIKKERAVKTTKKGASLSEYTTRAYSYFSQSWAVDALIARERVLIEETLRSCGSFSAWLDRFGREKFTKSVLRRIADDPLLEIHWLMTREFPLPPRLQRHINQSYFVEYVEDVFYKYVSKVPGSAEIVVKALTVASDPDLAKYTPKAVEALQLLLIDLDKKKQWTGGQLAFATRIVETVGDERQVVAGFFLEAMKGAGITDYRNASSSPMAVEDVRNMLELQQNFGLTPKQISRVLDDIKEEVDGRVVVRQLSLVTRFSYELKQVIVEGRIVPKEYKHVEETAPLDPFLEDDLDEDDGPPQPAPEKGIIEVSAEWLKEREDELNRLKTIDRPRVIQRLKEARELGDLSENAEYEEARNEQAFIEGRISALEELIKRSVVVEHPVNNDIITVGTSLVVRDLANKKVKIPITLVGPMEGDITKGRISISSPLGQALLGLPKKKSVNTLVVVRAPDRRVIYQILSID